MSHDVPVFKESRLLWKAQILQSLEGCHAPLFCCQIRGLLRQWMVCSLRTSWLYPTETAASGPKCAGWLVRRADRSRDQGSDIFGSFSNPQHHPEMGAAVSSTRGLSRVCPSSFTGLPMESRWVPIHEAAFSRMARPLAACGLDLGLSTERV